MPAQTHAQRQARRLALLNEAAQSAGWTGWRQYETAVLNGIVKIRPPNMLTPDNLRASDEYTITKRA